MEHPPSLLPLSHLTAAAASAISSSMPSWRTLGVTRSWVLFGGGYSTSVGFGATYVGSRTVCSVYGQLVEQGATFEALASYMSTVAYKCQTVPIVSF